MEREDAERRDAMENSEGSAGDAWTGQREEPLVVPLRASDEDEVYMKLLQLSRDA